jgi:hypothetical protein
LCAREKTPGQNARAKMVESIHHLYLTNVDIPLDVTISTIHSIAKNTPQSETEPRTLGKPHFVQLTKVVPILATIPRNDHIIEIFLDH